MTPEELERAMRDDDPEQRRRAVIAVAEKGSDEGAPLVLAALGDADWRVRKEAVRAAVELAPRLGLIPFLVQAIAQGDNVGLRNAALEALGGLGQRATAALLEALPRVGVGPRKFVVEALGDVGDPAVVPALVDASADADPNVAAAALDALARVGGPEAELALRARLHAEDPFQRMAALDGLDRLGAAVPWEELKPLLGDRLVRRVAIGCLGRCGHPAAAAPLVEALGDRSVHVASAAATALARLHDGGGAAGEAVTQQMQKVPEPSRKPLLYMLQEGDLEARQAAARLLALAQDPEALPGIVALAAEDALPPGALDATRAFGQGGVRPLLQVHMREQGKRAAVALELASDLIGLGGQTLDGILGREVREHLRRALSSLDPDVALAAARSFAAWAEPSDAPALVAAASRLGEAAARSCGLALEVLSVRAPKVVDEAIANVALDGPAGAALARVVARLGGPMAFERLQAAQAANDPATRRAAVEAMAQLGGRRAAELIGLALADEVVDVQIAAVTALGGLRDDQGRPLGVDALLLALGSDSPAVQAAAARALGGAGGGRAIEPLRELVRTAAPGVAVAAMEGLRALHDPTLGDLLVEALGHPDEEVVKQALCAIHESAGARTAARLALALEHHAWDVRQLAATLLGQGGGDEARAALHDRLPRESDDLVREAIERALSSMEGRR